MDSYTLYDLNEYIRQVMHLNFPDTLWVKAEVAQIKESRGQYYLTLIQKSEDSEKTIAQIDAMIWGQTYWLLRKRLKNTLSELLQEGLELLLNVRIDFNERYGLKLIIEDVDPTYTIGKLEIKRQQILEDLLKANLLNKNNQLDLPPVVQRLAVLSSNTAAGLQDYLAQLKNNAYGYSFRNILFPIAVQGINVEKELLAQLKKIASRKGEFDAVVIIRGGGSKIDLGGFDSFDLGKAVAKFPLPVIIGIGHEIDKTILDRVAHTSLKTPTAVAEFLIRKALHFESWLLENKAYLQNTATMQLQEEAATLQQIKRLLVLATQAQIKEEKFALNQVIKHLPIVVKHHLKFEQTKLTQLNKICELLAPTAIMKRGYTQTFTNGKMLVSAKNIKEGTILETQFIDGPIKSKVIK